VKYESKNFTPAWVKSDQDFSTFLGYLIRESSLEPVREAIIAQYPVSAYNGSQQQRVGAVIQDSTFVCNTRQLYEAYSPDMDVYMMEYALLDGAAVHASDLIPTFWNPTFNVVDFLRHHLCIKPAKAKVYSRFVKTLAPRFQSYLADLATSGDPNKHRKIKAWSKATVSSGGDALTNVLRVKGFPFSFNPRYTDPSNTKRICSFWTAVSMNITKELDKIPPPGHYELQVQPGEL